MTTLLLVSVLPARLLPIAYPPTLMPAITSANTTAPTMIIGQKGAAIMQHNLRYRFDELTLWQQ